MSSQVLRKAVSKPEWMWEAGVPSFVGGAYHAACSTTRLNREGGREVSRSQPTLASLSPASTRLRPSNRVSMQPDTPARAYSVRPLATWRTAGLLCLEGPGIELLHLMSLPQDGALLTEPAALCWFMNMSRLSVVSTFSALRRRSHRKEANTQSGTSATAPSDDPDTWHSSRALRNVVFPAPSDQ